MPEIKRLGSIVEFKPTVGVYYRILKFLQIRVPPETQARVSSFLDRTLASIWRGTVTNSTMLPAEGILSKQLIPSTVCAVLREAGRVSWLRLNLGITLLFEKGIFLGDGLG